MKSATKMLLNKTGQQIWGRGEVYADNGLVSIKHFNEKEIHARVQGTETYSVKLKFASNGISRACDCPYFAGRGCICKHIVATAIIWDEKRNIARPSQDIVLQTTVPPPEYTRSDIDRLYSEPLDADLDMLRILPEITALGGRGRRHSDLPKIPKIITGEDQALSPKEMQKCYSEIKRWSKRRLYDPYFCAGEMVAAFCETLKIALRRFPKTPPLDAAEILLGAQEFNHTLIMELIDDSQGLHLFSESHLEDLYSYLRNISVDPHDSEQFEELLTDYEDNRDMY
jgi:hypothetical protein